jgi:hypothetical protein
MKQTVLLLAILTGAGAGVLLAGDAPHLFYSRAFPGSKPDYI